MDIGRLALIVCCVFVSGCTVPGLGDGETPESTGQGSNDSDGVPQGEGDSSESSDPDGTTTGDAESDACPAPEGHARPYCVEGQTSTFTLVEGELHIWQAWEDAGGRALRESVDEDSDGTVTDDEAQKFLANVEDGYSIHDVYGTDSIQWEGRTILDGTYRAFADGLIGSVDAAGAVSIETRVVVMFEGDGDASKTLHLENLEDTNTWHVAVPGMVPENVAWTPNSDTSGDSTMTSIEWEDHDGKAVFQGPDDYGIVTITFA